VAVTAADASPANVDFGAEILPVLSKNCVACHNGKKAEGGLNLETHATLMQGGDSGPAVQLENIDDGTLLARVMDDDDPMPPEGNAVGAVRLSESEVAAIRRWIEAGAAPPTESSSSRMQWQPLPDSVHPIYALAASADGNYLAFGRGNQAFVVRQGATAADTPAFELTDLEATQAIQQSADGSPVKNAAHLDIVQSIAFSPDSQMIATGGYRDVKLWRRRTQPVESLQAAISLKGAPAVSSISPDGARMAAALDTQLEIVDLRSARSQRFLKLHAQPVIAMAWLDNSVFLLSADSGGGFVLTDAQSSQGLQLDVMKTGQVDSTGNSQSGPASWICRQLAHLGGDRFAAFDGEGHLAELTLNRESQSLTVRMVDGFAQVTALATSRHGSDQTSGGPEPMLAVGFNDGRCRLLNSDTWAVVKEIDTTEPVVEVSLDSTASTLVTSSGLTPAKVWRLADGVCLATLDRDYHFAQTVSASQRNSVRQQGLLERLKARLEEVRKAAEAEEAARVKVQETRDKASEELASKETAIGVASEAVTQAEQSLVAAEAALAEAMKLVETRKAELEAKRKSLEETKTQKDKAASELANREQALATAQDATSRAAQRIPEVEQSLMHETQKLDELQVAHQNLEQAPQSPKNVRCVVVSPDNSKVVVSDDKGGQHVFSLLDGSPEVILKADAPVSDLRATSDGRLVALSESGTAILWDLNLPWELVRSIGTYQDSPFSDRVTALDFSPDSSRVAVGSGPPSRFGEIKIVSVDDGQVVLDLGEVHSDSVFALKYSPTGRVLASGSADKQCRLFDTENGTPLGVLEGHTHHILTLAWKDDAVTLATGGADASVKLWNVEAGTQIRTVADFKKEVTCLAFIAQSDQFVATDATGNARLITAGDGKQLRVFAGADSGIYAIGVSPDGKKLFAGGQSGNQWVWQVEDGKQLK